MNWIRDWACALYFYACYKVWRDRKYKPLIYNERGKRVVRWSFSTSTDRLIKLMFLWGESAATEELLEEMSIIEEGEENRQYDEWSRRLHRPLTK